MKLVKEAYHAWGAEVVFITSNYQGNQEIMEGCKEAGIPAFVSRLLLCALLGADAAPGHAVGFLSRLPSVSLVCTYLVSLGPLIAGAG